MQLRQEDAKRYLQTHNGVLGPGWKEVESFEDLEDEDDYEDEEVEEYITLDMGNGMDARYLQTEATFQLIGLDTALPHLKIGNMVLQGEVTPLIGSEILLGLIRNQENPHNPSHPPLYATSNRITFRPIDLWMNIDAESRALAKTGPQKHRAQESTPTSTPTPAATEEEGGRSMFLQRPAKNGPNRPTVFPGRKRDKIRAEKRAQRQGATGSPEKTTEEEELQQTEGMDIDPALMDLDAEPPMVEVDMSNLIVDEPMGDTSTNSTPGAGPSSTPGPAPGAGLPSLDTVPDIHSDMFATGPRSGGQRNKTGRPRTRPILEVHSAEQMGTVNTALLPDNVRILVSPLALNSAPSPSDDISPQSLEFTRTQFKRFVAGQPTSGRGSRGGQSGTPRASLNQPYLMTAGTPTPMPARRTSSAVPSLSPLRMGQLPDPPEGLETEVNKDLEGMDGAAAKTESMELYGQTEQ